MSGVIGPVSSRYHSLGPVEVGRPLGRTAPGPAGTVLGGSFRAMRRDELDMLVDAANRYGDVVRFELGPRVAHLPAYLIRRPDHIHHILFEARELYPKSFDYRLLARSLGQGLVTSEGELWSRQRRLIQPAFRHTQVLGLAEAMLAATRDVARRWCDLVSSGEPVDVAEEMMRLALDVVGRTLFSSDLAGEVDTISPAVGVLTRDLVERLSSAVGVLTLLVPQLPTPANRRVRRTLANLDGVVARLIARRRSMPEEARPADLLSMLIAARDETTGEAMDDHQIRDEVMTFLVAGHETTANALTWTWYLLSTHPLAAGRLRDELRSTLAGRDLHPDDLDRLHYTKAVISEAMRLYPPVAAIGREASHDDEIGGYHIPARSTMLISPWVSHRNPEYWPAPEAFDPERFLPAARQQPRLVYLPFGAGPRQCIGAGFALQEAVIALATLAARYEPTLVPGQRIEPQLGVTLRPRNGLAMTIHRAA
jgi:cytochrome P450